MAKEALNKQDAAFARRIARRDESVVRKLERAYATPLRQHLARSRGTFLDGHDIDDIVAQALDAVWNTFHRNRGSSVRWFFFHVAKRRLQDRLRRNSSRRNAELEAARIADVEARNESTPDEVLADQDNCETDARINGMLEDAVDRLTERQRKALNRRFIAGGGPHWAKRLEEETGTPAKQWRKASDEARSIVRAYLVDHGVRYSREGGRYEVA